MTNIPSFLIIPIFLCCLLYSLRIAITEYSSVSSLPIETAHAETQSGAARTNSLQPPSAFSLIVDPLNITAVVSCFQSRSTFREAPRAAASTFQLSHEEVYQPFVILPAFMDSIDIANLLSLSSCVREFAPEYFEDRHFGEGEYSGNRCTFVKNYVPHVMKEWLDFVLELAERAAFVAHWRPLPSQLHIRCIEVLEYEYPTGRLNWHTDSESVYTLTGLLNPNTDFTGGDFLVKQHLGPIDENAIPTTRIVSGHSSGLLFDSEADHCVEPLTGGIRKVLCIELWAYNEPEKTMRPSAGGQYKLQLNEEEAKLHIIGREDEKQRFQANFEADKAERLRQDEVDKNDISNEESGSVVQANPIHEEL